MDAPRSPAVQPGTVHSPREHDSAHKHVAGSAAYVDDLPQPEGLLHAYIGVCEAAHAEIESLDLDAVRDYPGVHAVITAADIPGANDISPVHMDDEALLADGVVHFAGQPLFAVAAESREIARRAARQARIEYRELPAILSVEQALEAGAFVLQPHTIRRGDPESAIDAAEHRLAGELRTGGQDHFYLEGQVSMALPQEDGDLLVLTSSQHPTEVQELTARALGRPNNAVTVEVRRMGGAFGGKETQAAQWAVLAALLADRCSARC
jgi:xanthine dehydrogenase large subunit